MRDLHTLPMRVWLPRLIIVAGLVVSAVLVVVLYAARIDLPYAALLVMAVLFLLVERHLYHLAVYAAFALMSIVVVSPDPTDVLLLVLLLVGLLTGQLRLHHLRLRRFIGTAFGVFLIGYFLSALAGSLLFGRVEWSYLGNIVLKLASLIFILLYVSSEARLRVIFFGYLTSAVVASILAVGAALGVLTWSPILPGPEEVRYAALMNDPNVLGSFLVPVIIWLFAEVASPGLWRGQSGLKLGIIILASAALALTLSRGAWINLFLGTLVYLILQALRLRLRSLVLGGPVLIMAVLGVAWLVNKLNYAGWIISRYQVDYEDLYRFQVQRLSLDLAVSHPFGIGPRQIQFILGLPPHNVFVQVLSENGWITLGAFLVIATYVITVLTQSILRHDKGPLNLQPEMLLACFIGLMANAVVIDVLYWRIFWFLVALALVHDSARRDLEATTRMHMSEERRTILAADKMSGDCGSLH